MKGKLWAFSSFHINEINLFRSGWCWWCVMIVVCSILPVAKLAAASLIGQRLLARKETPAAFPAYCTLCFEPSPHTVFHPELQHEKQYNNVISRNCMATNSELNCFIYLAKLFESFFFWWVCCLKKHMTVESQTIFFKIRFIKKYVTFGTKFNQEPGGGFLGAVYFISYPRYTLTSHPKCI